MLDPAQELLADAAMERYATGDTSAFAELHRILAPELTRFVGRMSHDRGRTDDVVQQTFLQIHQARGRFRSGSRVAPWAFVIARRLFLDEVRRRRRDAPVDASQMERPDYETPEDVLAAQQTASVVDGVLEQLSPTQRQAFELVRGEGLSVAEAAKVAGTTVGALKVRAFRAYEALRGALGREP